MEQLVLCVLLLVCRSTIQEAPVVRTPQGDIRGSLMTSRLGNNIHAFRGIPYAKPPVGDRRFQPPEAADPWTGTLDATQDGASCPPAESGADLPRSEDCLILNVYTNKLQSGLMRPVLVFFHPGAWYSFTSVSQVFGPQYLMDKDVVLVTANYRLAVLGYVSTNDSVLPGNYGMKDQVAVLRWVQQNIAAFGGDPSSVTISGYSAGSASVMLHMVSPMSRGLFHRVIASSGSAFSLWSIRRNPFTYAQRLAQLFGCPAQTSQQIKDCLMNQDAQTLASSVFRLAEWGGAPDVIFGPVIESEESPGEKFLIEHPIDSLQSGRFAQVPIYTGMTTDELSWRSLRILNNETLTEEMDTQFDYVMPILFDYERNTPRSHNISGTLRNLYFQDRPINNSTAGELTKLFRDGVVGYGEDIASKVFSNYSCAPVYYYKFSYQGRYSWVYRRNSTVPYGVVHHDDLIYLFYISVRFPLFNSSDPESEMVETLTTLWTNFVITGNPTPAGSQLLQNVTWEPFTSHNLRYMDIGSNLQMKTGLHQDTLPVWDRLFYNQLNWDI